MRLGNKCKQWAIAALVMSLLLTGCSANENQNDLNDAVDAETVISENIADGQQEDIKEEQPEEPEEDVSDSQSVVLADDREIVCENPYFFPQNVSSLRADITTVDYGFITINTELELHWMKQYENGCLVKLSIVPFEDMPYYMSDARLNTYFYVTSDEIYRVWSYVMQDDEFITFYNDDTLLMSILDTDDKLIENGELVCAPEEMEEIPEVREGGTYTSITHNGEQIQYGRISIKPNGDPGFYENYLWENGIGLVEYISDSGADAEILNIENIVFND